MSLRFSLLTLLGMVTFSGLAFAALVAAGRAAPDSQGPSWWSSATATVTISMLTVCLLGAFFSTGRTRATWAGAAVAGLLYWLLVFSSWFGDSIGAKLITSKGIAWADEKIRSLQQPPQPPAGSGLTGFTYYTGPGLNPYVAPQPYVANTNGPFYATYGFQAVQPPAPAGPPATPFQEIAQYVLIWPLALLGGVVAGVMYVVSRRRNAALPDPAPAPHAVGRRRLDRR
ncbi:MAG: hypothetical protein HYS13_18750 [Planctomycetia bacterium]|nr:hypothetical protein [Planctomycetia bacterium]